MKCEVCTFEVPKNLRFVLMKNMCPACGSSLFSSIDSKYISIIKNAVSSELFAKNLDSVELFDYSLFVYNQIRFGIGKMILDEEIKKIKNADRALDDDAVESIMQDEEGSADVITDADENTPELETLDDSLKEEVRKEVEFELRNKIAEHIRKEESERPKPKVRNIKNLMADEDTNPYITNPTKKQNKRNISRSDYEDEEGFGEDEDDDTDDFGTGNDYIDEKVKRLKNQKHLYENNKTGPSVRRIG